MVVVDITRDDVGTDMFVGNNSMDAKTRTINYIYDYVFANYGFSIDKNLLDQHLNMDLFFLKDFMHNIYNVNSEFDLIIQSFYVDKDHCLFVKHYDKNLSDIPTIYVFNKDEIDKANTVKNYLINESLINKYQDNLSLYEKLKIEKNYQENFDFENIKSETISLYKGGLFLEELLNNVTSFQNLKENHSINL